MERYNHSTTPLFHAELGALSFNTQAIETDAPNSFFESQQTEEADEWREALHTHIAGKMGNGMCKFVPRPEGAVLVKSKLVLTLKHQEDNTILERCVRWVACGYSQIHAESYNETYMTTAKAASVHLLMCMILELGLKAHKTDIPKAFTRAELDTKNLHGAARGAENARPPPMPSTGQAWAAICSTTAQSTGGTQAIRIPVPANEH